MGGLFALVVLHVAAAPPPPVPTPRIVPSEAPKASWYRRRPVGDRITNPNGQGLIDLSRWPPEPSSPQTVEPERFATAMSTLCPRAYRRGAKLYAGWILEHSAHFDVDPFTVGALSFYRSNCRARFRDNGSWGLAAINVKMHAGYIDQRTYRYQVREDGGWADRTLPLKKHLFYERSLSRAESNIYFAAGLLKVLEAQCPGIDSAFPSLHHRHAVSHFYWGDWVRGTDAEDRVLIARRRLIGYYRGDPAPTVSWKGLKLRSPLDGGVRKLTSKMGDDRDRGGRRHMGIDFASERSEPVRAVAGGVVTIAGAQRKVGGTRNMPSSEATKTPADELGAGGLLVMVKHGDVATSAYMHLDDYDVREGQKVQAGDLLGTVGRSGVKESAAHLHFEIRAEGRHVDPMPILGDLVIGPLETFRGRRIEAEQHRLRRKRR